MSALENADLVFDLIHHRQRPIHSRIQLLSGLRRLAPNRLDVAVDFVGLGRQHRLRVDRLSKRMHLVRPRRN